MTETSKNTKLKVQENDVKTQKIKKMKKSVKKHSLKEMSKVMKMNVNESQVNEQQIPPDEKIFEQDDDFWDFYEQPFVKS